MAEVKHEKDQFELMDGSSKSRINLTPDDACDDYAATVYGSRWAGEDLPRHEMPVCSACDCLMTR